jgi:type VI secretion system secreted protein Hcp
MAVQIFMQVSTIKGASKDSKHSEWIDVTSLQTGVSQDVTNDVLKQTVGAGQPEFSRITVHKKSDISSPYLYVACAEGKRISEIVIEVCASSDKKEVLIKYTCSNCLITDALISTTAKSDGGDINAKDPSEEISFGFSEIDYWVKGGAHLAYDLSKNEPK